MKLFLWLAWRKLSTILRCVHSVCGYVLCVCLVCMLAHMHSLMCTYLVVVQGLLDTQLAGQPFSSSELLSDYLRVFQASTDAANVKMLQIKLLIPVSCIFPEFSLLCSVRLHLCIRTYVCVCLRVCVVCGYTNYARCVCTGAPVYIVCVV